MATLTIELRNLCLLARYGDEVTAVFPREKHDLFVVYRQGGAWHERAIPPGADVRLLDGQAGATVNLDAGDRFIPHCDAIFGAPVRMAADLLRQPANPEVVGARLWLPSGSVAGAPGSGFQAWQTSSGSSGRTATCTGIASRTWSGSVPTPTPAPIAS